MPLFHFLYLFLHRSEVSGIAGSEPLLQMVLKIGRTYAKWCQSVCIDNALFSGVTRVDVTRGGKLMVSPLFFF